MTENDKATIVAMRDEGRTLREMYAALPHVPARDISDTAFPPIGEILSPEERLLKAIFGDN